MFPSQLKKLRLNGTSLSERDLMVIGMSPQLEVLKLANALHGEVWKVAKGGFYRLKFLLLEDKTLKLWISHEYSFPCLKRLVLRFCYSLKKIPMTKSNKNDYVKNGNSKLMEEKVRKMYALTSCCAGKFCCRKRISQHRREQLTPPEIRTAEGNEAARK
nr:putative late blight resistance protein homolog R1B-17 [Ipomoea batatas]